MIAIDSIENRIWVIEVKDPFEPFSSAQLSYQIKDFHDDGAPQRYVTKLLKKAVAVEENPVSVAAALGIDEPHQQWVVTPLMVTRHPVGPGFIRSSKVEFTWLDKLTTSL